MPKSAEHDFAVNAFRIVEQAIGEHMDGTPLEKAKEKPATANRGDAKAKALSPERRSHIASNAAMRRWGKTHNSSSDPKVVKSIEK